MKKLLLASLFVLLSLTLTACGRAPLMNELDTKSQTFHYKNEGLGFQLDLPATFTYYQTQMKLAKNDKGEVSTDWHDLEFFVPSNDPAYTQPRNTEVPSYGKVIIVRVYEKGKYQDQGFEKLVDGPDRTYAIGFWKKQPLDWAAKWSAQDEENIKKSFKVTQ